MNPRSTAKKFLGRKLWTLLLLYSLVPTASYAQSAAGDSAAQISLIHYQAVVQFVDGRVLRRHANQTTESAEFQNVIEDGEHLEVGAGGTLKLLTRNECHAVIYGEGSVQSPGSIKVDESIWRVSLGGNASAVRWICSAQSHETVAIQGQLWTINGGELLWSDGKVLILNGQVSSGTPPHEFPLLKVLPAGGDTQDSTIEPWKFNQAHKPPLESRHLSRPHVATPPPAPKNSRWTLGPAFGGGALLFDVSDLNQSGLNTSMAQLQYQHRWGRGSFIALLRGGSFDYSNSNSGPSYNGSYQAPASSTKANVGALEVGYRLSHDRSFSPFFRVGVESDHTKSFINSFSQVSTTQSTGYSAQIETDYTMIDAALGVDWYYSPRWMNWLGLYLAAEVDGAKSVARGARSVNNENLFGTTSKPNIGGEAWSLMTYNWQLGFGILIQY